MPTDWDIKLQIYTGGLRRLGKFISVNRLKGSERKFQVRVIKRKNSRLRTEHV